MVEEKELELDSVTEIGMEERIVLERQKKRRRVTLTYVGWTRGWTSAKRVLVISFFSLLSQKMLNVLFVI